MASVKRLSPRRLMVWRIRLTTWRSAAKPGPRGEFQSYYSRAEEGSEAAHRSDTRAPSWAAPPPPSFVRQTFVEWAAETIPRSFWAGAFYHQQRAKGAGHNAAVRALAFKWIRILYRCWVDRTPYDESKYLLDLQRRSAPLLKFAAEHPS